MKLILKSILFFSFISVYGQEFVSTISVNEIRKAPEKLIPFPKKAEWKNETISFKAIKQSPSIKKVSKAILTEYESLLKDFNLSEQKKGLQINFIENNQLKPEEYHLSVNAKRVNITSAGETGWFYGLQTLRQLIHKENASFLIKAVDIEDFPDYKVRGFMLDVGRNFLSIDFLKKQIDILAKYKMNVFQWHLTDYPAWRIETKTHPELINPKNHRPTRDPGKYYTFKEIKELFSYAKAKQVQIIPEIDIPGHSTYFKTATGFTMDSPEGKQIVKTVLDEFFKEIPASICPYIHIGSDEVEIKEPKKFMDEMINFVRSYDRQPIAWTPGLPTDVNVISQIWKPGHDTESSRAIIDSWNSYINNSEPLTQLPKILLKPIGLNNKSTVLGGILCLWHDINLEDNDNEVFKYHAVYPAILTYAWRTWSNDIRQTNKKYLTMFPERGSAAFDYTVAFEDYLISHGKRFFENKDFIYTKQSDMNWLLEGPLSAEGEKKETKIATGGTIIILDRFREGGYFPNAKVNEVYKGTSYVYSEKEQTKMAWIGFETPLRANRIYQGLPNQGEWDSSGGTVKINDESIPAPLWEKPGFRLSQKDGWGNQEDKEKPWTDEEIYWTRPAVPVKLKKGWNKIEITCPGTHNYQNWMFTFVFLDYNGLSTVAR